jgi:hypothetical protein
MLTICTNDQEAEIRGTADDLYKVRMAIISLLSTNETSASVIATPCDPTPYLRTLSEFIIQRASGPTLISVAQTAILVTGCDDSLDRFSSWFNIPPDARIGYHSHFEPLPEDAFHSSESIPLIIALNDTGT